MPRFVVLRHELPAGAPRPSHWDLMFEHQGVLLTWATTHSPDNAIPVVVERLADHRLVYLDYEGPVAGNRGTVTRWDAGRYDLLEFTEDCLKANVLGTRLHGAIELTAKQEAWVLSYLPDEPSIQAKPG